MLEAISRNGLWTPDIRDLDRLIQSALRQLAIAYRDSGRAGRIFYLRICRGARSPLCHRGVDRALDFGLRPDRVCLARVEVSP